MKRIFKWSIIGISGILTLVILISTLVYNNWWPKDPDIEPEQANLEYFRETYVDAREGFRKHCSEVKARFDSIETGLFRVPSKVDDDLTVDWCYILPKGDPEKLLILNSGLHGIEGYTGSAIQGMFFNEFLDQDIPDDMGILLIHGLNPYGLKYHRKVTENNVDLNRNCVTGNKMFDIPNPGYGELTGLLMPEGPVNMDNLRNRFFHLVAIERILEKSMPVLRQAALQGQYNYPKGFYYGGTEYEPQINSLEQFLTGILRNYNSVLNIDLHTAYGERGKLHLFIDRPEDLKVLASIEQIFTNQIIDWGGSGDFYTIHGEYIKWVSTLAPNVLCIPMLFEFGTMDSQETFGSLKSIQVMIVENQGTHYGFKDAETSGEVHGLFDEMYYPTSPVWRSMVMDQAREMLGLAVENFEHLTPTKK